MSNIPEVMVRALAAVTVILPLAVTEVLAEIVKSPKVSPPAGGKIVCVTPLNVTVLLACSIKEPPRLLIQLPRIIMWLPFTSKVAPLLIVKLPLIVVVGLSFLAGVPVIIK